MQRFAPAKLNLHLRVGPPGPDGFHPLHSWMVTTDLHDRLRFTPAEELSLCCSDETLPIDGRNLVLRAALRLREESGLPRLGARIELEKRIPSGGGLGGGSSDAAATLLALDALWSLGFDRARLARVAADLGSDVTFFLFAPSADCRGRGQVVRPLPPPTPRSAVLLLPGMAMSTPRVYQRLDELRRGSSAELDDSARLDDWASLDASSLLPRLRNDLEPAAFSLVPSLAELRDSAERLLRRPVRMSGSGSTLFTLYDTPEQAVEDARQVADRLGILSRAVNLATHPDLGR